ncbi:MAG: acetylxylan esterase [Candidatus Hydrogenedentes bacterium]|nr:acetylxylan esterase [Candidatus Hydrogenedentota bacterium]
MYACLALPAIVCCAYADELFPDRYTEPAENSRENRQVRYDEIGTYVQRLHDAAAQRRDAAFQPDFTNETRYVRSTWKLRESVCERIGYPPPMIKRFAKPRYEKIADDPYATIYRVWVEVLDGVEAYGLISIPRGLTKPAPLMVCQHGGGGNPELVHGMIEGVGAGNYGWMTLRALKEGYVTLEPALLFPYGGKENIEGLNRHQLDQQLQYLGTSILAVELYKIFRLIDVACARSEVDRDRIGMMGLSYGGLYTLYAAALDTRIGAAVSSCYFNERRRYLWQDWSFFNFMNEFNDAELCALICPRPFLIEVGDADTLFAVDGAKSEALRAKRYWDGLGISDRFVFEVFAGGHEFKGDHAYEFMRKHVKDAK